MFRPLILPQDISTKNPWHPEKRLQAPPDDYLIDFCQRIQALESAIRFVGIADYAGVLVASYYRKDLVPLMNQEETAQYAKQTVFRARTRGGFKPQLGEQRYAVAVYEHLIRATITLTSPEAEHHSMYFLVSLDIGCQYASVLEQRILTYLKEHSDELFVHTRPISAKYTD
jgi:hypothetical protein